MQGYAYIDSRRNVTRRFVGETPPGLEATHVSTCDLSYLQPDVEQIRERERRCVTWLPYGGGAAAFYPYCLSHLAQGNLEVHYR